MEEAHSAGDAEGLNAVVVARLEELLRALPEAMRVAVVLRYQEEMLPDEIAKLLGQPVATVKSHLLGAQDELYGGAQLAGIAPLQ